MNYTPEFRTQQNNESAAGEEARRELAACYVRVFTGSDDGRRVLADLRRKFGVQRLCFVKNEGGRFDYLAAAIRDGERHVLADIEAALMLAAPAAGKGA